MALRIPFAVGLGVGYVLGARAGRQQYDSLARAFRSAKEQPAVQEAAGVVVAQASGLVDRARQVATGARQPAATVPPMPAATGPSSPPSSGPTILSSPPNGQVGPTDGVIS
jgi:hypothetical protein